MKVYVGPVAGKGRGVFAGEKIFCGEMIESSPAIVFSESEWKHIKDTIFTYYCYLWGEGYKEGALVLGFGSLYNHSYEPNAQYVRREDIKTMDYVALRDIEAGEEITINYNGEDGDMTPVWFDVVE